MTRWTLEGLCATLGGFRLGPIDLEIGEAETVAVIGRSGAGKTTLLRSVAGLVDLAAGEVRRDGVSCTRWPPERRRLGYVPRGLALFPHLNVQRNIRFAAALRHPGEAGGRTEELLERFRLRPFAGRRPAELSTGEQQRVAVARALASEPELLLWDEPLGALDVATRKELLDTLATVREDDRIPLVLVTHDPSIAYSLADRFLLLEEGRMRFLGAPAPLVERPGDPFVARFLGYENVFSRDELHEHRGGLLGEWLLSRSGPQGLAFVAGAVALTSPEGTPWKGVVRRLEPTPSGIRVDTVAGGLALSAMVPLGSHGTGGLPGPVGSPVGITVNAEELHPLGGWS
ncbi:MAG: ABC transporter ATP-binding protein [Thermoplasmata archaeon]|nr:ABC transporter ATP-binding protein [Thermoplasmata archaeon]